MLRTRFALAREVKFDNLTGHRKMRRARGRAPCTTERTLTAMQQSNSRTVAREEGRFCAVVCGTSTRIPAEHSERALVCGSAAHDADLTRCRPPAIHRVACCRMERSAGRDARARGTRSNLESPSHVARDANSNRELPSHVARDASSNPESPSHAARDARSNLESPSHAARDARSNRESPSHAARDASSNPELPSHVARDAHSNAEAPPRVAQHASADGAAPARWNAVASAPRVRAPSHARRFCSWEFSSEAHTADVS